MLGGDVTDMVEARSLSFRPHYVDIYLASWGPEDDGATLEGPGPLTQLALQKGVQTVRKKKKKGVGGWGLCSSPFRNLWAKLFTHKYRE